MELRKREWNFGAERHKIASRSMTQRHQHKFWEHGKYSVKYGAWFGSRKQKPVSLQIKFL